MKDKYFNDKLILKIFYQNKNYKINLFFLINFIPKQLGSKYEFRDIKINKKRVKDLNKKLLKMPVEAKAILNTNIEIIILPYYPNHFYIFNMELDVYYEEFSNAISKWGMLAKQNFKKYVKGLNELKNAKKCILKIYELSKQKEYKDASVCQLCGNLKTLIQRKQSIKFSFRKQIILLMKGVIDNSIKYYYSNNLESFDLDLSNFDFSGLEF